ncbi:methyl-accepting chemotaxis sensory transducer [Methylobacterium sp. 4-46]|uniref:methyl-accepting chemotaxis protein n=1 Tax=unclassified Methylobacterium TaxID=2615210 RepID=UPI000152CD68|nr:MULTISPECIES: CHASE3 domain-containing protein [Methylobacterium]ACA15180.1 methyl-accepting chemotaxis sensory transducer [Methylobacterium sp. 4-46]WFT80912.1 CHASE3 domain-containing protein [Methylobacterium nodulans]
MRTTRSLGVSGKLSAAFALLALVTLAASAACYLQFSSIEQKVGWTQHTYDVLGATTDLTAAMVDQETGIRGYIITADTKFLEPYQAGRRAYGAAFDKAKSLTSDNPAQQARLGELDRLVQAWSREIAEREIALTSEPSTRDEARASVGSGAGKAAMDRIRAKVAEIERAETDLMSVRAGEQQTSFRLGYAVTLGGVVLGLVLPGLLSLAVVRTLARPIQDLTAAMRRLAEGDRTVPVPGLARRDEVGAMAAAVEVFKRNAIEAERLAAAQAAEDEARTRRARTLDALTQSFDRAVSTLTAGLAGAASEMEATAQSMMAVADDTTRRSATVAGAAGVTSTNVQTVAAASEEMSVSIQEIVHQVTQSARIADRAVENAKRADATAKHLTETAERIGTFVSLISGIAGQTNLLALNATIEAARAGEAGRGFAVVAAEVKELANQTGKATDEIGARIGDIQGATRGMVADIQEIGRVIEEISAYAAGISAAVEEQGSAVQEITRNVQEAARGTEQVTTTMSGVRDGAGQTSAAATQVLGAARDLARQSEVLRGEVAEFLAKVRAA